MKPPQEYNSYLPIIEEVFNSGVDPFIELTGFDAVRIITGVETETADIDPFFTPGNPQRGNIPGGHCIFTTNREDLAYLEALGHTGDGIIPPDSYKLTFHFEGKTLNFDRVEHPEFRSLYFKNDSTQEEDHSFSQCVDFYLQTNEYSGQYDSYGWLSVLGMENQISGFVHACHSLKSGALIHQDIIPLT